MTIPDQAQHLGGVLGCPQCRAINTIAAVARPAPQSSFGLSRGATPSATGARPSRASNVGKTLALVVIGLFGTLILATLLPWIAVPLGVLLTVVAMLYLIRGSVRLRVDRMLGLQQPRRWLRSTAAVGVAVWSAIFLVWMGTWVGTGGAERAREERAVREAQAKVDREARDAAQAAEQAAARVVEQERQRAEEQQRAAEEAKAKEAHERELVANAEKAVADFGARLASIEALTKDEKWTEAHTEVQDLAGVIDDYKTLTPLPPGIAAAIRRFDAVASEIDTVKGLLDSAAQMDAKISSAASLTEGTRDGEPWKEAKTLWTDALALSATLGAAPREYRRYVPKTLTANRKLITKKLKEADKLIAAHEKAMLELAAYLAICGEEPLCGGGQCLGIAPLLKQNAHDPDSIEVEACTDPVLSKKHCWVTTCKWRGKNMFGALVLNAGRFSISKLGVEAI